MVLFWGFYRHLLLLCSSLAVLVNGQTQIGFISIDCGAPENLNFLDNETGISYASDEAFIQTGENRNISLEFAYPNNPRLPQPLSDLRSFPVGDKNCYALKPTRGSGGLNMIRATFMYGDYDGENKPPQFELYLDVTFWTSVFFNSVSDVVTKEIISTAASDTIHVCLVNIRMGNPFISALELRPLNNSIYNTEAGALGSLALLNRLDLGSSNGSGRYRSDIYDRIWTSYRSSVWDLVRSSSMVDTSGNGYKVPGGVLKTAVRPGRGDGSLNLYWNSPDNDSQFYVYMHFAELEKLKRNQTRKFSISWNGSPLFGNFVPRYLYASTLSNTKALVANEHQISINKSGDSTLPPILNAIEVYMMRRSAESLTYNEDAIAIKNIRRACKVKRNWVGDPCGPKNYTWEGLKCSYNGSGPPRIVSLNLTSSNLQGEIIASIGELLLLESLDLSNNRLTGPVPDFLAGLQHLLFLDLRGNNLSGSVNVALMERSEKGLLTLRADDRNLCNSDSCDKKKKNIIVPTVAPILSALFLLIVSVITWKLRKRQREMYIHEDYESPLALKKLLLTYAEIVSITNNFEVVVGKGGFGTVYLGHLKDGTEVAVKLLSKPSSQGSTSFKTEADLLMRIHHRNLVSLIGYCNDSEEHTVLVYEYMANGNLKDYLSVESSQNLSWEQRLQVAIDAAQGLEYLHHGCKPPIIHRDV